MTTTASSQSCTPSPPTDGSFENLIAAAQACRACPSMEGRVRVLSHANGSRTARVMLVGEAPGRIGTERTGIPFSGDESGRRLDRLLQAAGWDRADVFITNAVLCNPRDDRDRNRPPSRAEVAACSGWLSGQIEVIDPLLVVALGAVALRALARISPHNLYVADAGSAPIPWRNRWLAAAYHPGARAAIHRPVVRQIEDFRLLGAWFPE